MEVGSWSSDLRYVMVASIPPAVPPAIKETSGDLSEVWRRWVVCQQDDIEVEVEVGVGVGVGGMLNCKGIHDSLGRGNSAVHAAALVECVPG